MQVCVYAQIAQKNFASCRLREKNFASLRLRQNLVELCVRLSLLVEKTIFQCSVLTINCTTIYRRAPRARPQPAPQRKGTPWTRRDHHQRPRRHGSGRAGRAGSPPAPARCGVEGDALDRAGISTSARRRGKVGRPGPRAGITSARRGGRGRPGPVGSHPAPTPPCGGAKIGGYMPAYFTCLSKIYI